MHQVIEEYKRVLTSRTEHHMGCEHLPALEAALQVTRWLVCSQLWPVQTRTTSTLTMGRWRACRGSASTTWATPSSTPTTGCTAASLRCVALLSRELCCCWHADAECALQIGVLHWFARLWEIEQEDYWGAPAFCLSASATHNSVTSG